MDEKYTPNALELNSQPTQKNWKVRIMYSGTNEIKKQIKLSVELSLHAWSQIDAKK